MLIKNADLNAKKVKRIHEEASAAEYNFKRLEKKWGREKLEKLTKEYFNCTLNYDSVVQIAEEEGIEVHSLEHVFALMMMEQR